MHHSSLLDWVWGFTKEAAKTEWITAPKCTSLHMCPGTVFVHGISRLLLWLQLVQTRPPPPPNRCSSRRRMRRGQGKVQCLFHYTCPYASDSINQLRSLPLPMSMASLHVLGPWGPGCVYCSPIDTCNLAHSHLHGHINYLRKLICFPLAIAI